MDRLGAAGLRHLDDRVAAQVANPPGAGRRSRYASSACSTCSACASIVRMDRDGADRQAPAGADHAAGDLAAVGDEDLREHQPRLPLGRRTRRLGRDPRGLRFSRNAAMPSRPSARRAIVAMRSAVSCDQLAASTGRLAHGADQVLRLALRRGAAREQRIDERGRSCSSRSPRRRDLVHQPQARRPRRASKRSAGQEIAARRARADRRDHVGRDHRRDEAELRLGERERRRLRLATAMSQQATRPTPPP